MLLKGETVRSHPFSLSPLPSPPPSLVAPATQATYYLHCRLSLVPVVLGDFGCDVIVKLVAFGSKPPLVTRIAQTGLGTRLLPVDMKDEYLIPGSGLESVAKIEYFLSEIEKKFLKGHYWHNPLVSHHSRWQDSHWPQPHNAPHNGWTKIGHGLWKRSKNSNK